MRSNQLSYGPTPERVRAVRPLNAEYGARHDGDMGIDLGEKPLQALPLEYSLERR